MFHSCPARFSRVAIVWERLLSIKAGIIASIGVLCVERRCLRGWIVGITCQVVIAPVQLALLGARAEAAVVAVHAAGAAQAVARVFAVDAAPVKVVPVGIPVWLRVIVKAAGEAGIVSPVLIVAVIPAAIWICFSLLVRVVFSIIPVPLVVTSGVSVPGVIWVSLPATWISIIIRVWVIA